MCLQISLPNEKRRNATALYNPMPLREVQKKYNYLPWVEYINALLPEGLKINENEVNEPSRTIFYGSFIAIVSLHRSLSSVYHSTSKI